MEQSTLCDTIKKIKYFWQNKNLRMLVIFLLVRRIGLSFVDDTATALLLRNGFPVEILTTISLCMIPLEVLASFIANHYSK